jgi:hypothetical protein
VLAVHELVAHADILVESLNPIKLGKLGLDPASLCAKLPRPVYCSISGYGLDGPDSGLPGDDLAAQARFGLMSVARPLGGSPQRMSTALSDIVTGMCASLAVSAAVVRQRTDGTGELIDVSLLDSDIALLAPRIAAFLPVSPSPPERRNRFCLRCLPDIRHGRSRPGDHHRQRPHLAALLRGRRVGRSPSRPPRRCGPAGTNTEVACLSARLWTRSCSDVPTRRTKITAMPPGCRSHWPAGRLRYWHSAPRNGGCKDDL